MDSLRQWQKRRSSNPTVIPSLTVSWNQATLLQGVSTQLKQVMMRRNLKLSLTVKKATVNLTKTTRINLRRVWALKHIKFWKKIWRTWTLLLICNLKIKVDLRQDELHMKSSKTSVQNVQSLSLLKLMSVTLSSDHQPGVKTALLYLGSSSTSTLSTSTFKSLKSSQEQQSAQDWWLALSHLKIWGKLLNATSFRAIDLFEMLQTHPSGVVPKDSKTLKKVSKMKRMSTDLKFLIASQFYLNTSNMLFSLIYQKTKSSRSSSRLDRRVSTSMIKIWFRSLR